MEGGEQMREGLSVIHLYHDAQRKQADRGALVGEQRLQCGDRSRVAKTAQGLESSLAHLILWIVQQGEQGGKGLCTLVATAHDGRDGLAAHPGRWISQSSQQVRERDGGCLHRIFSYPLLLSKMASLTLLSPTARFSASVRRVEKDSGRAEAKLILHHFRQRANPFYNSQGRTYCHK
jgi:hypothetical protein